jgi:kynurenine formamidase
MESSVLTALRTATRGRVYSLAIPLSNDLPASPMHGPLIYYTWFSHEQGRQALVAGGFEDATIGIMTDRVEMPLHGGTHMDAPAHFCRDGRLLGGVPAGAITPHGASGGLGVDGVPPIIAPGVLLDVAGARGVDVLESGYRIMPEDLETARKRAGLPAIARGSAVLVRTGWLAANGRSRRRYYAGEPGLSGAAGEYLEACGIVAVGADNHALEAFPPADPHDLYPVHQRFLVESYVPILENVWLDDLARDHVHDFLFVVAPLPFRGATGSPVAPIAVA